MIYPEKADCHFLGDDKPSREYIEQVGAEAMELYRNTDARLALSKELAEYLSTYQKQFMPEDADAGMVMDLLDNYKGDKVCTKLLWKEALRRDYEPKRMVLKQISDIMNNTVTDWELHDGVMHFAFYGKQRGGVRIAPTSHDKGARSGIYADHNGADR